MDMERQSAGVLAGHVALRSPGVVDVHERREQKSGRHRRGGQNASRTTHVDLVYIYRARKEGGMVF